MVVELEPDRDSFLRGLLEEERRRVTGANDERKRELRSLISARESELADNRFTEWEVDIKRELARWKDRLAELEANAVDSQLVLNNARERVLQLLETEARKVGLLPQKPVQEAVVSTPENFGAATADKKAEREARGRSKGSRKRRTQTGTRPR